jgi:hypothetical protein
VDYDGPTGSSLETDIGDELGGRLVAWIPQSPAQLAAELILDSSSLNVDLDVSASGPGPIFNADWSDGDSIVRVRSNLPAELHAEVRPDGVRVTALPPLTGAFSWAQSDDAIVPRFAGDYVVGRLGPGAGPAVAIRLTGLARLDADLRSGVLEFERDSMLPLWLDLQAPGTTLRGTVQGTLRSLAIHADVLGTLTWMASDNLGSVDLLGSNATTMWSLTGASIPRTFEATIQSDRVQILSTSGTPFGSLGFGYSSDGSGEVPVLDGPGFATDRAELRSAWTDSIPCS